MQVLVHDMHEGDLTRSSEEPRTAARECRALVFDRLFHTRMLHIVVVAEFTEGIPAAFEPTI